MKKYITIGFETSCDETSVCIMDGVKILSIKTFSQIDLHSMYGGVVPEIASRDHLMKISQLTNQCIAESGIGLSDIGFVSCTTEPGLIGSLLTGILFAKGLSVSLDVPFVPVNHIDGHIFTCNITHGIFEDFLCLLVSGGHTAIYDVDNFDKKTLIGHSIDDSIGEVFDKISKSMGFGYPGGAKIEKIAKFGDCDKYVFSIPLKGKSLYNFSMSGIKTEFLKIIQNVFANVPRGTSFEDVIKELESENCKQWAVDIASICASFQKIVTNIILDRLKNVVKFQKKRKNFVLCGGVASNFYIRNAILEFCNENGMNFCVPDANLCTDNAAMIANAGMLKFCRGLNFNSTAS